MPQEQDAALLDEAARAQQRNDEIAVEAVEARPVGCRARFTTSDIEPVSACAARTWSSGDTACAGSAGTGRWVRRTWTVFLVPMKRLVTCSSSRTMPLARSDSSVTFTVSRAGVRLGLNRNRDSAGLSAVIERLARPASGGGHAQVAAVWNPHRYGSRG
jgi:hypothetical protein